MNSAMKIRLLGPAILAIMKGLTVGIYMHIRPDPDCPHFLGKASAKPDEGEKVGQK